MTLLDRRHLGWCALPHSHRWAFTANAVVFLGVFDTQLQWIAGFLTNDVAAFHRFVWTGVPLRSGFFIL